MTEKDIHQLKVTILSGLKNENILKFGAYAWAVVDTIFIIQLIKQIIALIVNFKMLKAMLVLGFHLIGSLFTSLMDYLIRNNIHNVDNQVVADPITLLMIIIIFFKV